jgi:transcriptional regulator with XRE-family HTH domain
MTQESPNSVTARRMLIGARLRQLREAKGISRDQAGYTIRASESKMSRLELGRVAFKERDVADLLMFYGITDPEERDRLLALAREANRRGWWREYEDVLPGWFQNYIGLEEAAAGIRSHEIQFVPGLLQTEDYARAVVASGVPTPGPQETDRAVELRMARQRILHRSQPPHLWVVLDEAALRRPVGSAQTQRHQLKHLLEMVQVPQVALQVLPFRSGSHAAAGGAFTLLRFDQPDLPDVVYVEQLVSALYLDRADHVERYVEVMNRLSVESLTPVQSADLIRSIHDDV